MKRNIPTISKSILLTFVTLVIITSCSNKSAHRETLIYYDEEKTVLADKNNVLDSILENGTVLSLSHGEQTSYFRNGTAQRKENYFLGELHGESIEYYGNGKMKYKKNYEHDVLHGEVLEIKLYGEDGIGRTVKNYHEGHLDGMFLKVNQFIDEIPDTFECGLYSNDKKQGKSIENCYVEGFHNTFYGKHLYTYENGVKNGFCQFSSGWKGMLVDGKMDGLWKNGKDSTLSANFKNGVLFAHKIKGNEKLPILSSSRLQNGRLSKSYGYYPETHDIVGYEHRGCKYQEIELDFYEESFIEESWKNIEEGNSGEHQKYDYPYLLGGIQSDDKM